jgi:hypothetical protein
MSSFEVSRALHKNGLEESALRASLEAEGLGPYSWSAQPGVVFTAHRHGWDKTLVVMEGTITFLIPEGGGGVAPR